MNPLFNNYPTFIVKPQEKPVINNPGWYMISSSKKNQIIKSVIHDYKKNGRDVIDIHEYAYYYNNEWKNNDTFTNDNWNKTSVLTIMNPNMGYWIFIKSYNRFYIK